MITKTVKSKIDLNVKAEMMTNVAGLDYLEFISGFNKIPAKIVAIYIQKKYPNHFNVLSSDNISYSLPFKNSGCKGSGFGSKDYLMKTINGQQAWQATHNKSSYIEII